MAAQQALDVLMAVMPPLRCVDILSHKLPSDAAVSSGTAVEGDVLCATVRCLQVGWTSVATLSLMCSMRCSLLGAIDDVLCYTIVLIGECTGQEN
jgi:DNA-binding transcriptional regulator YdaS (Cro superfamily)